MIIKQTVLIAGSTGNVGGGAALSLAKRGAKVVLLGRKQETLETKANSICLELSKAGIAYHEDDISTLVIDFADFESVKSAAAEALSRFSSINALILSVGRVVQDGPHILPNGHEIMFATSVIGPFLFTSLLLDRLQQSNGLSLQVIAPFYAEIDWNDIESIKNHKTTIAYNRAKTCERVIAGELSRRYAGKICSVAFNPTFIIDKADPGLMERWPKGLFGIMWWIFAVLLSKPPAVAGEPIADIVLSDEVRKRCNGTLFKLNKRLDKPDKAMNDEELGRKLWNELVRYTGSEKQTNRGN